MDDIKTGKQIVGEFFEEIQNDKNLPPHVVEIICDLNKKNKLKPDTILKKLNEKRTALMLQNENKKN